MKKQLNAITVKRLLVAALVILGIGAVYACYVLQGMLAERALEANHAKIDVSVGNDELEKLATLRTYLDKNKLELQRASSVVAESKGYEYQDQIIKDINSFANSAGVTILGFDFPENTVKSTAGLKTITANVTLKNPVNYLSFLRFLKLVEQNLTKMQITDITVSPEQTNAANINSPSVGLEVYVQ